MKLSKTELVFLLTLFFLRLLGRLVGFLFNFYYFSCSSTHQVHIIILSLFGLRFFSFFFFPHSLTLGLSDCIHRLFPGARIVLANMITICISSNYRLRVFTYSLKEKYWLHGSKITIFMSILLVRYYPILVWWSLLCS